MEKYEDTLIIIKPDAVDRGLEWRILQRFQDAGLKVVSIKRLLLHVRELKDHYREHKDKPFFDNLLNTMHTKYAYVVVLHGPNAISKARQLTGSTNCSEAAPGTIRGDFGNTKGGPYNLVHSSADLESAIREKMIWFWGG